MNNLLATITETMRAFHSAYHSKADLHTQRVAKQAQSAAERRGREAFAELNGWRLKSGDVNDIAWMIPRELRPDFPFGLIMAGEVLGEVYDHSFACRATTRPWKMTALVCQPYEYGHEPPDKMIPLARARAEQFGMACHIPPNRFASIYYPGKCLFLVFTKPGTEVKWLPEQLA
jgi:hypothetical protein